MPDTLVETRRRALAALIPPPRLDLATWIEENVYLPSDLSATPGRVKLWPHQIGIARAISDPEIERVTVQKSVRVGYSMLLTATIAAYIANEPSPILALLPTEADARDFVVSDLEPTFAASPILASLLSGDRDESGRNTLLSRRFPGGSLKIVAARAPRNLRRHTARILAIDECDAMEIGSEGDPVLLGERRTMSFASRKILLGSTPTFAETSRVVRAYSESDARVFETPCPSCGDHHELVWRDIRWPEGAPEQAFWCCPSCGSFVEERHKIGMISAGRWRATRPEVTAHAGFKLSALISTLPNASCGRLAREYVAARDRPDQLQTFVNTILGEPWREAVDEVDPNSLAARAEPFGLSNLPQEVLLLSAGVDCQHDRLEIVILGFARDGTIFVLANWVVWGPWDSNSTWAELDEALKLHGRTPAVGTIRLSGVAVDAGDGVTMDAVLSFCQPRFARRVVAIKGASGNRPAIKLSQSKRTRLFVVGTDTIKGQLAARLARGSSIRFSTDLDARYFEELTSERLTIRYQHGAAVRRWERIGGRQAEGLDATVYGIAVRGLIQANFDSLEAELSAAPQQPVASRPAVFRSSWMAR